jgi:RTX calcium-binding nonapeptide repeat (4 copies)
MLLGALLALALSPATATALDVTSMTVVEGGREDVLHPANAQITVRGGANGVTVNARTPDEDFSVEMAAPRGAVLRPGVYAGIQRAPWQGPGRPGLNFYGRGFACSANAHGLFEIRDIAIGLDGRVERLWALFEFACGRHTGPTFGEVRIKAPVASGSLVTTPGQVRWPSLPRERPRPDRTVLLTAGERPARIAAVEVVGEHAADFPLRRTDCAGRALPAGHACELQVGFVPSAPGPRSAALRIKRVGAPDEAIPLEGHAWGGATQAVVDSDPSHEHARGEGGTYTPADSGFSLTGREMYVSLSVRGPGGAEWTVSLDAPEGHALAPGRYERPPGVRSRHGSCNSTRTGWFEITALTFDQDGLVDTLAATFEERCRTESAAARGTVAYRAHDDAPPAPWMVAGPRAGAFPMMAAPSSPARTSRRACGAARFARARTLRGTARGDRLRGTRRAERILAGAGRDRVRAGGGNDCVDGGPGRDVLDCGAGRDTAYATRGDRTRRCERVVRR